jgi:hypothetical protein
VPVRKERLRDNRTAGNGPAASGFVGPHWSQLVAPEFVAFGFIASCLGSSETLFFNSFCANMTQRISASLSVEDYAREL